MLKKIIYFVLLVSVVFSSDALAKHKKHKDYSPDIKSSCALKPGKIIFINGSCSSGKSSIAKELTQKLDAQSFAFDELVMPKILQKFIVKHYGRFFVFFINKFVTPNFFSKVDFLSEKKKYKFQMKFLNDLKNGLADEPTLNMYADAKRVALQGKNVVIESPLFLFGGIELTHCLSEFEGTSITYVLAYCPWNDLIDRLKKRNSSPNKKNHRELDWVVGNYMNCFNIVPEKQVKRHLECFDGSDVHTVVQEYSQAHYKKKQLRLLKETQQVALQRFPQEYQTYYIYPRFKYNVVINTRNCTPKQGASAICTYLKKKNALAQKRRG